MNRFIGCGRLTKDPDVRYSQSGSAVAHMTIAIDRRFKKDGGPTADFFPASAFGKTAEFAEKYLKKGTKVIVSGRMETDSFKGRDGQDVKTTQIVIDEIEFAESKAAAGDAAPSKKNDEEFLEIDLDSQELPFNF